VTVSHNAERAGYCLRRVCVIIPTFRPTLTLVERVAALSTRYEVVVLDDDPGGAGASEVLARIGCLRAVTLLRNHTNLGIAATLNRGVRHGLQTGCEGVVTLDQDTDIGPVFVEQLLAHAGSPDLGVIGPGNIDGVAYGSEVRAGLQEPYEILQSGMYIPAGTFARVGLFDEGLFIDSVDTDFCLRVRDAGLKVYAVVGLDMQHQLGGSRKRSFRRGRYRPVATDHPPFRWYYIIRNRLVVLRRYGARYPRWALVSFRRLVVAVALALTVEQGRMRKLLAMAWGAYHALVGRAGPAPQRISRDVRTC